jgi:hypothetical protein
MSTGVDAGADAGADDYVEVLTSTGALEFVYVS